jgi:type IV secretion system protein VirD4
MTSPTNGLYHIPKAQKDITRFVFVGLGLFAMIVLLSCWAATEYAAWALGFVAALGKPMLEPGVYFPFDVLVWTWKFNSLDYGTAVMAIFERAHIIMGVGGFFSLVLPVALAFRRTRKAESERNDLHGSAHWALPAEVLEAGILPTDKNKGGVLFGAWEHKGKVQYLRHKGPEHMMVFAPTRSGKGVGIVIPTLLSWDESVLVLDIKGENWALTSGFRHKILGQRTLKFDPTSTDSARFNPLQEIRIDGNLVKDVQNIATMIVDPNGEGLKDHWAKTGFDLMTGVVLFVLLCEPPQGENKVDRCIATVLGILSDGGIFRKEAESKAQAQAQSEGGKEGDVVEGARAVIGYIRDIAHAMLEKGRLAERQEEHDARHAGWMAVAQAMQSWLNKPDNEAGSVLSTALSFLSLYRDPIVAENTRVSDFSLESLMGGKNPDGQAVAPKTSLYLVVPPSDKDRLKPLLRLVISQVVRRLTEGMEFEMGGMGKSRFPHKLLLLIDEFPSLGKLEIFQEALAFIAGYGLKALLIVQDLTQLNAAYGKDESIVSNCHIRVAYAPNKVETAKLLSEMAGQATVTHTQRQYSGNRLAVVLQNVNTNEQIVQRPLLTADECMRLPPEDELVFVAGFAPVYCQKIKYYQDPALAERIKFDPKKVPTGRGQ